MHGYLTNAARVKYPAPLGNLAKNKLGHALQLAAGYLTDGKEPEDDFTRELDEAVRSVRKNEKWRLDYMTLQMNYQEKYEQGIEQGIEQEKIDSAMRMIEANKLSLEEIVLYSGLTLEQVYELEKELQPV